MRCPECQQEVVLARTCPYCGASVPQEQGAERAEDREREAPRGRFQGRLDGSRFEGAGDGPGESQVAPGGFFGRLFRYMTHPQVPAGAKLLVILAALYLLSPVDLVPVFFPGGWLDDLGLLGILWFWLNQEFKRYL
ncbi:MULTISPECIES: YkvA family protein [Limnochorda]|uniref:YkvA family protein n=1 Tax=Limnochorda TaxID=1676651 RepID=UPI0026EABF3C|nr:YkvA family protein [Limnochorda pilosa]